MAIRHLYVRAYFQVAVLILLELAVSADATLVMTEKDLTMKKHACYTDIDSGLWGRFCTSSSVERENCALRCISLACYNLIYADDPLEEGEVDSRRGREFKYCVRREARGEDVSVPRSYE
ncbi:hypothetical protein O6H91_11G059100 [Diphasiastrum complanatum]|uniref:Uncharacterized protein n=1 Tax=Diphasiastrum complanatum TaxID=34168 RepID=A0ACC2CAM3_DIPCM|nr:hypothetical protein O6H91_11G059100 [Diphasiastrum complanatum]